MRPEIRIGLLLAAAACLLTVMVDWVVEELTSEAAQPAVQTPPEPTVATPEKSAETPQAGAETPQAGIEGAQVTAEGSQDQG
jgi:hypothetical protein